MAAQLNQIHYKISPLLLELYSKEEEALSKYIYRHSKTLFYSYQKTLLEHVGIWQNIFEQCNLKAGKKPKSDQDL